MKLFIQSTFVSLALLAGAAQAAEAIPAAFHGKWYARSNANGATTLPMNKLVQHFCSNGRQGGLSEAKVESEMYSWTVYTIGAKKIEWSSANEYFGELVPASYSARSDSRIAGKGSLTEDDHGESSKKQSSFDYSIKGNKLYQGSKHLATRCPK